MQKQEHRYRSPRWSVAATWLGGLIASMGVLSIVAFVLASDWWAARWVDQWGRWAGWTVRLGLIAVGGALLLLGGGRKR